MPRRSNSPQDSARRVVVVGAGIVGVSTAIWLQRLGKSVVLIDRGVPESAASHGNGGVLASCSIVPVNVPGLVGRAPRMLLDPREPLFLKWGHLPALAPWLLRYLSCCTDAHARRTASALFGLTGNSLADHLDLSAGTDAEQYVRACDYFYLYPDRSAFRKDHFGWSLRREFGFQWDELDSEALQQLEPLLDRSLGLGIRLKGHGRITDPGRYVEALIHHAEQLGGRRIRAEVTDLAVQNGRIIGVRAGGELISGSAVVVAAGAWSGTLVRQLGLHVPLESERGYHIDLYQPNRMPVSPFMFAGARFVATPMDERIRLAGIVEFGGLDAPASKAPFRLLLRNIRAAMPGLTWRQTSEWMGHRPATADSIPVIGAAPRHAGAFLGFGHHHIGLTAGPKTGQLLAHLVCGMTPNIDLACYAPSRFQ